MATTTNHLGLTLPAGAEPVSLQVLNDNWQKTETGILKAFRGKAAHNLLDNSDFRNPVNQRGLTSYTTIGYTIDRWYTIEPGAILTVADGYITISANSFAQKVQAEVFRRMTNVTLAFASDQWLLVGSTDISQIGVGDDVVVASNSQATIRIYRPMDALYVVYIQPSTAINLYWAALYEGVYTADTLPGYVPKGYATELAECMRYYYETKSAFIEPVGKVDRSPQYRRYFDLPVPMRVFPTMSLQAYQDYTLPNGMVQSLSMILLYHDQYWAAGKMVLSADL